MTTPVASDLAIDRELASIAESFRFLVDLTPINVEEAKQAFLAAPLDEPEFAYRDLEDQPEVIGARLSAVDVDQVKDETLASLFRAKRRELTLQLEMLEARESVDFLALSLEMYGPLTPALERQAHEILVSTPRVRAKGQCLNSATVARKATAEIDAYREVFSDLAVVVEVRDDISGVMVSNGDLLIAETASVAASRLNGLLAHEVGTHVLTYVNGSRQPLKLMAAGLAAYEETQEGLALIAEALVGGLTSARLRQIAARVIAVDRRLKGLSFVDTHRVLHEDYGFSQGGAFMIVMRVWRSGGLTKDAIYLRGLQELVEHLAAGGSIEPLWQGKMSLVDLPLVAELTKQGVLNPPALLPGFLSDPSSLKRMKKVAGSAGLHHLIGADA